MKISKLFKQFAKSIRGNVAMSFGLASVALVGAGGGAIDYVNTSSAVAHLQSVSDAASLVGAKEMQLSGDQHSQGVQIISVSKAYVLRNIKKDYSKSLDVTVAVNQKKGTVDLSLKTQIPTPFFAMLGMGSSKKVSVASTAQVLGGLPLCVLTLEETREKSIEATGSAKLTATGCTVHANSSHVKAIEAWGQAYLNTGLTCSVGGADGGGGNFNPAVTTDCPLIEDPLRSRASPMPIGCHYNNYHQSKGIPILFPGVYCGGIKLTDNANAVFLSGTYIIKDGPFEITDNARAGGLYTGFYFTGKDAIFKVAGNAEILFTAPKNGVMAGLLMYEDRNIPSPVVHKITSSKVRKLVGTIYLPKSEFLIDVNGGSNSTSQIAQESAFTVIVARTLTMSGQSNLVLNTDFAATDVPVPTSISGLTGQIILSK